jgi:hypothetical protein
VTRKWEDVKAEKARIDRKNGRVRRLYIAGPMTGLPEQNFPAFRAAAAQLVEAGYEVTDPSTLGEHDDWAWADYLKRDLPELLKCDGVAVLDGWSESKGASIEVRVADELGMQVWSVLSWVVNAPRLLAA